MKRAAERWVIWILVTVLAAAGAAAGYRWRELRDGWRVSRVRRQPGYAELRSRWQRVALAGERLQWPAADTRPGQKQLLAREYQQGRAWPGAAALCEELRQQVNEAESRAYEDFTGRSYRSQGDPKECGARTIVELVRLRASRGLSETTFERAMLALVRRDAPILEEFRPEAQRAAALVLCDLVGDGGPPVVRQPAADLAEALSDAARTRRAGALCMTWKVLLRYWQDRGLSRLQVAEKCLGNMRIPAVGDNEREAFGTLEALTRCTRPLRAWSVESGKVGIWCSNDVRATPDPPSSAGASPRHGTATDPGWRAEIKSAEEALAGLDRDGDRGLSDQEERLKADPALRERLVGLIEAEAGRLPVELRAPYFSVLHLLLHDKHFVYVIIEEELVRRSGHPGRLPSPSLRLVAEIVMAWG